MNCSVCGNPLTFDRVIFHCSCGMLIHSYCWEKHVLAAHEPSFKLGAMALNGEFIAAKSASEEEEADKQADDLLSLPQSEEEETTECQPTSTNAPIVS